MAAADLVEVVVEVAEAVTEVDHTSLLMAPPVLFGLIGVGSGGGLNGKKGGLDFTSATSGALFFCQNGTFVVSEEEKKTYIGYHSLC